MGLGFYHNSTICIECKACMVACKDLHDLPLEVNYRRVASFEGGKFPNPWVYFLSISCNHCENPACVANCPTGAMSKSEDGIVLHDDEICIGCQTCVQKCPYGAPQYFADKNLVGKCDSCKSIRDAGGNPACVDACIMRALEFGDIDELKAAHADEAILSADLAPMPSSETTTPNLVVSAKECAMEKGYKTFDVK